MHQSENNAIKHHAASTRMFQITVCTKTQSVLLGITLPHRRDSPDTFGSGCAQDERSDVTVSNAIPILDAYHLSCQVLEPETYGRPDDHDSHGDEPERETRRPQALHPKP